VSCIRTSYDVTEEGVMAGFEMRFTDPLDVRPEELVDPAPF